MAEVATLKLRIDSHEAKTAASDLDKLGKASKSVEKEAGSLGRVYQGLGRVISTVALGLLSREVIQAADAYKNMNARLQLVTSSMSELIVAQQGVFDISQRTRVGLGQTTDLFASLARSTESLGVSQEALLQVTESINQSLTISGTSAQGAAAALVQLGQGFASGVLRGEELNSVLEQAPRLARALADGLGVPVGKLRELGAAGELTAEKVFAALQKSGASLNQEFARMPITVEQATTQAGNSISRLIGIIDKATGATGAFASAISGAARGLDVALNRFSEDAIIRAQAEVDTLGTKLLIALQSKSGENPGVKLLQKQLDDAKATLEGLKTELSTNQSGAESARLGRSRQTTVIGPDLSTISGLQDRIKALKELRDNAKLGSADFKKFSAELATYEGRLKTLLPSKGGDKKDAAKPTFTTYSEQITQNVGGLLESSDVTQAKVYADTLKQLDELYFNNGLSAELYESALKKLTGATSSAEAEASKFIAEQQRLAELLAATESAGIEKQREDMALLAKAFEAGTISEKQYLEAVTARLDLVADKTKEAKSMAEEFGLSFSSAFEDAVVGGGKLSDVLKGLADDITRIIVRTQVTEPLAKAARGLDLGGLISGLFGGGGASTGTATGADLDLFFNAKGGAYNSPGLSAYSGQIVDKPTLFPFARGAGIMGEAGPEAILPLQRGSDGRLGVSAGGGGGVSVTIINQSGTPIQANATKRGTGADGTQILEVVLSAVGDALMNRSGPVARGLEGGYGIRPSING